MTKKLKIEKKKSTALFSKLNIF